MFARVNIVYERRQDALQLPRTAILDADGQQSVFVVADGKAQQRTIQTGLANGGWIEVLDGLKGDERVVTVGQAGLKTGTPVKVVGDVSPAPSAALAADKPKAR
jgi:membrane fusion protein (multidrug efflux system)